MQSITTSGLISHLNCSWKQTGYAYRPSCLASSIQLFFFFECARPAFKGCSSSSLPYTYLNPDFIKISQQVPGVGFLLVLLEIHSCAIDGWACFKIIIGWSSLEKQPLYDGKRCKTVRGQLKQKRKRSTQRTELLDPFIMFCYSLLNRTAATNNVSHHFQAEIEVLLFGRIGGYNYKPL